MKLAEALLIRADLQSKLSDLEMRLMNNAVMQEGEDPAEDPNDLLKQVENALKELESLIACINLTNAKVGKEGQTMTALLAKRDVCKRRLSIYRSFLDNASMVTNRSRVSEIKVKSTVPVSKIQKDIDKKSAELRKLEITIQELNWLTDLSE